MPPAIHFTSGTNRPCSGLVDERWDDGGDALQGDDVAGLDAQHRLDAGEEVTDVHGLRARHQRVLGGARGADVRGRNEKQRAGGDIGYVQLAMTAQRGGKHGSPPANGSDAETIRGRETK
jgi:hypothetical protein